MLVRLLAAAALATILLTTAACGEEGSCIVTTAGAKLCGEEAAAWCSANENANTLSSDAGTREACRQVRAELDDGESRVDTPEPPKEQFAGTCGSCHTLADAGTNGSFGPNLDELMPDKARVLAAIAEGPGSMPAGLFEGDAADAVAGYVASAAGSDG